MRTTLDVAAAGYLKAKTLSRGTRNEYQSTLRKWGLHRSLWAAYRTSTQRVPIHPPEVGPVGPRDSDPGTPAAARP
jgi:hypothetical protein